MNASGQRFLASALACALWWPLAATASSSAWVAGSLEDQVDRLVREGFERPEAARAELERLPAKHIAVLQGLATLQAQAGHAAQARAYADPIAALARDGSSPNGAAVAALVRAQAEEAAGQLDDAGALAQSATGLLQEACNARRPDCDYRAAWRALRLMQRRSAALNSIVLARSHEQAALAVVTTAGDGYRRAVSLATLAILTQRAAEAAAAQDLVQQAVHLADAAGDATLQARVRNDAATVAEWAANDAALLRWREEALSFAHRPTTPRLEVMMLANLSDTFVRLQRPAEALQATERALAIARSLNDGASESVLVNNAGLAKIRLGRVDAGKQDLATVLAAWKRNGDLERQAETLREYGEALATAGDARTALALYHQEREISANLMKISGVAALKELRLRNDAEAKQHSIDLVAGDNALKTEELANGGLRQRIAWLVAAVMALSIGLVGLLYLRVRETNRRLSASHDQLRVQSERDPLTGLANRRHVHATLQALAARQPAGLGFEGALLLVDVDHFKQVNDAAGHAGGDQVLAEMARRLNQATRRGDLVARWGGEEFLILAPKASTERADQLAARVLAVVAGTPIQAEGQSLRVTASVGYVRFPLPPHGVPVTWEQAINLVDLALYTAKSEGRHRAVGIAGSNAATGQALRAVEADFDLARREGRVVLVQAAGSEVGKSSANA